MPSSSSTSDRRAADRGGALVRAGHHALAWHLLAAGVRTYYGVPGFPATSVLEDLELLGGEVEDAQNEKVAAELAFGATRGGRAAGVVCKGNGAFLAAEPLQNAGPHTIGAPLLLLVGDDVHAASSTVPTDARPLGVMLHVPAFDLPTGDVMGVTVAAAVHASVQARRPVIVRFTDRVAVSGAPADEVPLEPEQLPTTPRDDRAHRLTKLSRYLDYAVGRAGELDRVARTAPVWRREGIGERGILAAGQPWNLVGDSGDGRHEPVLGVSIVHPLPPAAVEFGLGLREIVVLEHGEPFLEDAMQRALGAAGFRGRVLGQRTGHVPPLGVTSTDDVARALDVPPGHTDTPRHWKAAPRDRPAEFELLFDVLREVQDDTHVVIHSCVGSCIATAYPPYQIVDSALNLGGSIAVAAGHAAVTGSPTIALIGDYGVLHSGLSAHDQVYQRQRNVLTIVLANGSSAKTGGQPSAAAKHLPDREPLDLVRMLSRAAPEDRIHIVDLDQMSPRDLGSAITGLLATTPATLVIVAGEGIHRPDPG